MIVRVLKEVRKEDNMYFKGCFWFIGNSVADILEGKYTLVCNKIICSYNGSVDRTRPTRKYETHESVWNENFAEQYGGVSYKYFPRGRVEVYNGKAYINLNSILNRPDIIDSIRKEYEIENLEERIGTPDTTQGSHYDFELK